MKRILITVALVVISLLGLSIPSYANVNNCTGSRCIIYYTAYHGWNDWGGNISNGAPINFYNSSSAQNSKFEQVQVGQVCNGENYSPCLGLVGPFTNGSGLNARYDGRPIYRFETDNDTGDCVDDSVYSPYSGTGNLDLVNFCGTTDQEFVLSSSYYLVPVGANNSDYAVNGTRNLPVLVSDYVTSGVCNVTNGNSITETSAAATGGQCQLQWNITNST